MKLEHINPGTLPDWGSMFTQVVVTEKHGLRFVHISGQVGVDLAKKVVVWKRKPGKLWKI